MMYLQFVDMSIQFYCKGIMQAHSLCLHLLQFLSTPNHNINFFLLIISLGNALTENSNHMSVNVHNLQVLLPNDLFFPLIFPPT